MKKLYVLGILLCVLFLSGCNEVEETTQKPKKLGTNEIYAYFVNMEQTDMVPVAYYVKPSKTAVENIDAIMKYLSEEPDKEETTTEGEILYQSPIPEGITYIGCTEGKRAGNVELTFHVLYDSVDAEKMLFFKGCIVKTILQLKDVDTVSVSMTDIENVDAETATIVENFDQDSFTMSFGEESGYKQEGTIVIYFADETGEYLKEYRKTVEISNSTSLARLVVESLIEGPQQEGYQQTISVDTTIRNISVKDGICYVDLSDAFYDTGNPLRNDLIVYSVVNSLVELPTVNKVQFLKNGEKQTFFRETMPFDGIFERNLDLNEQPASTKEQEETEPEEESKEEISE